MKHCNKEQDSKTSFSTFPFNFYFVTVNTMGLSLPISITKRMEWKTEVNRSTLRKIDFMPEAHTLLGKRAIYKRHHRRLQNTALLEIVNSVTQRATGSLICIKGSSLLVDEIINQKIRSQW